MSPVTVEELVARIPNGASIALPADYSGCAMTAVRALIDRGVRDLLCWCACRKVASRRTGSWFGMRCTHRGGGRHTGRARHRATLRRGHQVGRNRDVGQHLSRATRELQAGMKGLPFIRCVAFLGSDLFEGAARLAGVQQPARRQWREGSRRHPARDQAGLRADARVKADRNGNVWLGVCSES